MKIKTGIIFGGSSKLREKSFQGASFLYYYLPSFATEKVLVWINKEGKYFKMEESCLLNDDLQLNISREIEPLTLGQYMNIALVTISADDYHNELLFDTLFQLNIPNNLNTLSRKFASDLENWWNELKRFNFRSPSFKKLSLSEWNHLSIESFSSSLKNELGESIQILPIPHSAKLGGSIIEPNTKVDIFQERLNRAFFRDWIRKSDWQNMTDYEKNAWTAWLSNPLEGPDFPLKLFSNDLENILINEPQDFIHQLDKLFTADLSDELIIGIEPIDDDAHIHLVGIPNGVPFQSIIWYDEDTWQCLPPFINKDQIIHGNNQLESLTELQVTEISAQMIQLGQSFLFNAPQVISGFVTSTGKSYPIEIQPFLEVIDEKKWFLHLGTTDHTPTSFLTLVLNQILSLQSISEGISGKIASQLNQVLTEKNTKNSYPFLHAILLDAHAYINQTYLIEAIGWYEKLAYISPADQLIVLSEGGSRGTVLYMVPARWLYLSIQKNMKVSELMEKIRSHCHQIDTKTLNEKGYTVIPVTSGKIAAKGKLFQFLETEKIPYWGPEAVYAKENYTKNIQLQTLHKNGFKIIPSCQISTWLQLNEPISTQYLLSSNEYIYDSQSIEIHGEHEITAFKQFLLLPQKENETQRNRKVWTNFFNNIQDPDRINAFLQVSSDQDDFIILFFKVQQAEDCFIWKYLSPIQIKKEEDLQIKYHFNLEESEWLQKIQTIWTPLTEEIEKSLEILGINCTGFVRFNIEIFIDKSFQIHFKEINPFLSVHQPWIEKLFINNKINWDYFIFQQNLYARFKKSSKIAIEEKRKSIHFFEEKKLSIQHLNSDIVSEKAEIPAENPHVEGENRIMESMNNLAPTRFSKNFKDYTIEIWNFLKSWFFLKNMLALMLSLFLVINIIKSILYLYTRHGSGKEVIDYAGMRFESAMVKAENQGFKLVASDEVYVLNRPAGIIISQVPEKGSKIKSGRTIYCVITGGEAPSVTLPKLSNNDEYESYQKQLIRLGVYSRIREERFEADYEEKTILEVFYDGKKLSNSRINAGQVKLPKGSYLDFVISVRNTDKIPVPDLICNTYEEAVTNLIANDLTVGTIIGPENDESFSGMYVFKQEPSAGEGVFLAKGSSVILYIQAGKPEQCLEF